MRFRWVLWSWLVMMAFPEWGGARPLASDARINVITEEWPPYNYTEEGVLTGSAVQLVQALQKALGRDDPIRVYPSMRAKLILESQPRTMMFSMFRTPEREIWYKWIGPIGRDAIYFYQRAGSPLLIRTLDDAKAVSVVACRQAGLVFNTLTAAGFTNLDTGAYSSKQVYGKLLRGRADLAISDSADGVDYQLQQWGWPAGSLVKTPVRLLASDLYIAASPDFSDAEIARWQAALERLKANNIVESLVREFD